MNDRDPNPPLAPTPSQTVGPFFHVGLAQDAAHGLLFRNANGRIRLAIRVFDGSAAPVTDALVEIWQKGSDPAHDFTFGRLATDVNGCCEFETVRPASPPSEAAHVNVCLFARGLLRHLHTRIYFADDTRLADDPVLASVPEERRRTLLAAQDADDPHRWTFDIRLQGSDETVFFDA